jgi:hypothetical protein
MRVAVTFCAQAENERRENENHDSFFRGSEKESLPGLLEFGTPTFFQLSVVICRYFPSGVVTSVPGGGVNSNVDGGTGARVWFE